MSRSTGPGLDRVGADLPTGTLLEILETESWEFRTEAVDRLLARRDPESAPRLLELLKSERPEVRAAAARLLGALPEPLAFKALVPLLQDTQWVVRFETAQALAQLGDPRAVPSLVQTLRSDAALQVRRGVASSLRGFPGCDTAAALRDALSDAAPQVRRSAAASLAAMSGRELGLEPHNWEGWVATICRLESDARKPPRGPE